MNAGERVLIVNADDLGHSTGINAGIFTAHEHGIVTSATLMVGLPAAREAAESLVHHPGLGVGLHITLTGSCPLLPPERVPSLVDANGRFPAKPDGHGALDPAEVRIEVEAQLERFRALVGRLPTHLDSHHHSHRLPVVREVVIALAREHRLPVRRTSAAVGERLREAGVRSTDAFVERFFGPGVTLETLLEILAELAPGTTELMCHPGRVDANLHASSSYVHEREQELDLLTRPEVRQALTLHGVRLAHFGTL